jgi:hypothetical protein
MDTIQKNKNKRIQQNKEVNIWVDLDFPVFLITKIVTAWGHVAAVAAVAVTAVVIAAVIKAAAGAADSAILAGDPARDVAVKINVTTMDSATLAISSVGNHWTNVQILNKMYHSHLFETDQSSCFDWWLKYLETFIIFWDKKIKNQLNEGGFFP